MYLLTFSGTIPDISSPFFIFSLISEDDRDDGCISIILISESGYRTIISFIISVDLFLSTLSLTAVRKTVSLKRRSQAKVRRITSMHIR